MSRELLMMQNNYEWTDAEGRLITADKALSCKAKNLLVEGKTYQDVFVNRPNSGANSDYTFKPDGVTFVLKGVNSNRHFNVKDKSSYMLKTGTYYTYVVNIIRNNNTEEVGLYFNTSYQNEISYFTASHIVNVPKGFTGTLKFLTETKTDFSSVTVADRSYLGTNGKTLDVDIKFNYYILEGNYTNTDLPAKINGIESVAERESKNLLENVKWHDGWVYGDGSIGSDSAYQNAIYSDLIDVDTSNLYYTNIVSYSDISSLRYRCYDINGVGLNISTGNIKELYTGNSFKPTKKIRILILDKTVTSLPSNPLLLPNLYTEGDVNVKGTNSYMCVKKQINVKPNTTYAVRVNIESINKGDNNYNPRLQIKKGSNFICETTSSTTFNSGDNTSLDIAMYVNNAYVSTTDCEANFKNIAVTEANLYPIKLTNKGKNLLDLSTFIPINNDYYSLTKSGDVITMTGKGTADKESVSGPTLNNLKVYLEEGKTYSASFKSDGKFGAKNGEDTVEIFFMLDGTTKHYFNVVGQRTVTIPKGYSGYYYVRFDVNSGDKTHQFWDIQVEEGSIITDYEPYRNTMAYDIDLPVPMRSLPNGAKDTVEGNKLMQRVDKIVLDGSRNYTKHSSLSYNDMSLFYFANGYINKTSHIGISSKLPCYDITERTKCLNNQEECIILSDGSTGLIQIILKNTSLATQDVAGLKAYLRANPITLFYELATPIEHELNIPPISIAKGGNIITTTNNITPNLSMKYKKSKK